MPKKKLTISQNGIDLIKSFEGIHDANKRTQVLEPMRDPVGYWTLGYGSRYDKDRKEVTAKTAPITLTEAEQLLRRDVSIAELYIDKWVKCDLTQCQYDALCSIVFNIGAGNFQKSQLLKALNANCVKEVHFTAWRKAAGKVLPGLVKRRACEYALFTKK